MWGVILAKYKCKLCGYIYDEEVGDERKGIAPGTLWEDIASGYKCPSCGVPKTSFVKVE